MFCHPYLLVDFATELRIGIGLLVVSAGLYAVVAVIALPVGKLRAAGEGHIGGHSSHI